MEFEKKPQPLMIGIFIVIFIAILLLAITFYQLAMNSDDTKKLNQISEQAYWGELSQEAGMFTGPQNESRFNKVSVVGGSASRYQRYQRRAYNGAPPQIPHPINKQIHHAANACLTCHRNGGYVEKFSSYTPVTPHPKYENCLQCHVPQTTKKLFKQTKWQKPKIANLGFAHLAGSPPVIPHSLHLRSACLSCHSGPAAIPSLLTSHPERTNCRQCHVTIKSMSRWQRAIAKQESP